MRKQKKSMTTWLQLAKHAVSLLVELVKQLVVLAKQLVVLASELTIAREIISRLLGRHS